MNIFFLKNSALMKLYTTFTWKDINNTSSGHNLISMIYQAALTASNAPPPIRGLHRHYIIAESMYVKT